MPFKDVRHYTIKNIIPNANALFVFVLIISGNYIADLFPCRVQKLMRENVYMKHLVGFMIMYFLTILTFPELKSISGIQSAIFLYILFILTTKIDYIAWVIVMFIYALIYLLNIYVFDLRKKKTKNKKEEKDKKQKIIYIKRFITVLIFFNIFLILLGFIYRVGLLKMEYKKKFSFSKFIQNIPNCNHSHTIPKKVFEPFRHIFD
jgi:hypothetical protein